MKILTPLVDKTRSGRLDLVLEPKKGNVTDQFEPFKHLFADERLTPMPRQAPGGTNFYSHSFYDLCRLAQDSKYIELNFNNYGQSLGRALWS